MSENELTELVLANRALIRLRSTTARRCTVILLRLLPVVVWIRPWSHARSVPPARILINLVSRSQLDERRGNYLVTGSVSSCHTRFPHGVSPPPARTPPGTRTHRPGAPGRNRPPGPHALGRYRRGRLPRHHLGRRHRRLPSP